MSEIPQHPLIGITGGIGAGKSVLSRILRLRGLGVYDCDLRARILMQSAPEIVDALEARYGNAVVSRIVCKVETVCNPSGSDSSAPRLADIDRGALARFIFQSEEERLWVNALVHGAVRRDVVRWQEASPKNIFVESAILCESKLSDICSEIWVVDAPIGLRKQRALERRIAAERKAGKEPTPEQIEQFRSDISSRIRSQFSEFDALSSIKIPVHYISNIPGLPLLSQIPKIDQN